MKLLFFLLLLLAIPAAAHAQAPSPDAISQIAQVFYDRSSAWGSALQGAAFTLFRWTLILEVALFGIRMALQRSQTADILGQFVMVLLFAGFVAAVITHYQEWAWNLIDGLAGVADSLGASREAVEAPFKTGLALMKTIIDKIEPLEIGQALGFVVAALIVLVCFTLMTAQILLIKAEAMIAMNAAIILLGLGGSAIFKEYAVNVMRYVLSVAFKLFVLQLVLGMSMSFITDLELAEATLQDVFVVVGVAIVFLALVWTIPDVCAGIINGSNTSSGQALKMAGAAVAGAAIGAVSGGAATAAGMAMAGRAVRKASQVADAEGASGFARFGHMAKSLYAASEQARAEHPGASHARRIHSKLNSQLQERKMDAAMQQQTQAPEGTTDEQ